MRHFQTKISWVKIIIFLIQIPLKFVIKNPMNNTPILVQVIAWCHQATIHYLNQCWSRSTTPYGLTLPQDIHHLITLLYNLINIDIISYRRLGIFCICEKARTKNLYFTEGIRILTQNKYILNAVTNTEKYSNKIDICMLLVSCTANPLSHYAWTGLVFVACVASDHLHLTVAIQQGPILLTWFNFNPSMDE